MFLFIYDSICNTKSLSTKCFSLLAMLIILKFVVLLIHSQERFEAVTQKEIKWNKERISTKKFFLLLSVWSTLHFEKENFYCVTRVCCIFSVIFCVDGNLLHRQYAQNSLTTAASLVSKSETRLQFILQIISFIAYTAMTA